MKDLAREKKILISEINKRIAENLGIPTNQVNYAYKGWVPMSEEIANEYSKFLGVPSEEIIKASKVKIEKKVSSVPFWIVRNIEEYNNCYIPDKMVKQFGNDNLIKELENITGKKIRIKKFKVGAYEDMTASDEPISKKTKFDYIAEVYEH